MARTKVAYTDEDNKAIEAWVRNSFIAVWHWLGTSAMKPREQKGVVDARLNVYGVEGLKVAGKFFLHLFLKHDEEGDAGALMGGV